MQMFAIYLKVCRLYLFLSIETPTAAKEFHNGVTTNGSRTFLYYQIPKTLHGVQVSTADEKLFPFSNPEFVHKRIVADTIK